MFGKVRRGKGKLGKGKGELEERVENSRKEKSEKREIRKKKKKEEVFFLRLRENVMQMCESCSQNGGERLLFFVLTRTSFIFRFKH